MAKILCIYAGKMSYSFQLSILRHFSFYGFLDVAIISEYSGGIEAIHLKSVNTNMFALRNVKNGLSLFPDKLKNLNKYQYRIVLYSQPPRVIVKQGEVITPMMSFIRLFAEHQNAGFQINVLKNPNRILTIWNQRDMDLTLNTAFSFPHSHHSKLLTYEEQAYCALVPLSNSREKFQLFFLKPFETQTWLLLVISIVSFVCVWKLFNTRGAVDSHWLVGFGVIVTFIGQGINFSNDNRVILKILFNLIILMIFMLSTAYESIVTSFMIQPFEENRLEGFDQILASDYEILTDEAFLNAVKDSQEFIAIKARMIKAMPHHNFGTEIKRQHFVIVMKCDDAEYDLSRRISKGKTVSSFYYLLPEKIIKSYVRLEASFLNPFIDRLQYFMDLSFQAGLPHIWKVYAEHDFTGKTVQQMSVEPDILKLHDLIQVFYILLIGCTAATVVLLFEIFFQESLKNLQFACLGRGLRNKVNHMARKRRTAKNWPYQRALYCIIHQHKKVKRLKKLKIRRVFVKPKEAET
ncbi:hypothetical protein ACKWTF_014182 [Chironomus riparius]